MNKKQNRNKIKRSNLTTQAEPQPTKCVDSAKAQSAVGSSAWLGDGKLIPHYRVKIDAMVISYPDADLTVLNSAKILL